MLTYSRDSFEPEVSYTFRFDPIYRFAARNVGVVIPTPRGVAAVWCRGQEGGIAGSHLALIGGPYAGTNVIVEGLRYAHAFGWDVLGCKPEEWEVISVDEDSVLIHAPGDLQGVMCPHKVAGFAPIEAHPDELCDAMVARRMAGKDWHPGGRPYEDHILQMDLRAASGEPWCAQPHLAPHLRHPVARMCG